MRKAFNFFRSYYDVAMELNDKDRLAFYDALLNKQFNNCEPTLNGMAKFAYLSQKHSIDNQLKGYYDKTKDVDFESVKSAYVDPCQGGSVGGSVGGMAAPSVQEKEEEKEEDIYMIDFDGLLSYINNAFGRKFTVVSNAVKVKYKSLLKQGYKKDQIISAINNCKNDSFHKDKNYQYCTIEYFSRSATIDKYGDVSTKDTRLIMSHPTIID